MLPPLGDLHRIECWLLHHGLHLKAIRPFDALRLLMACGCRRPPLVEGLCQTGIKVAEAGGHARGAVASVVFGKKLGWLSRCARLSGSASVFEIGESPRCRPVLRGLRDRCIAAMLATRAEVSGHAPQAAVAAPSGFQPAAARSSALTSMKLAAPDGFAPSTSRVRAGRSAI